MPRSCPPLAPLDECAPTLDQVLLQDLCPYITELDRYNTDCGGTLIDANFGTHGYRWTFDSMGELVDISSWDDVPNDGGAGNVALPRCPNPCQRMGAPEALCGEGGAGGATNGGSGHSGEGGGAADGGSDQM
jgi:hypothetical protein